MVYQCEVCGKEYTKLFNFSYHVAHHSDERPFPCELDGCPNKYKTKADMRQHMKSHEKALGVTFHCFECNIEFESSTKLNVHKRDYHYSILKSGTWCEKCERHFANLRNHVKTVHDKLRPYTCDLDGKSFSKMYGLTRHIETVHLKLSPYQCDQCEKKFKAAESLKSHMKQHTRGVRIAHRKSNIVVVNHWSEDEEVVTLKKKFKCGSCSVSFTSEKSLLKHEQLSHPKSKYFCDACQRRFTSKLNLKLHITNEHTLGTTDEVQVKAYKCGGCKKVMNSKSALERHKKNIHFDEYDFMCDQCSATFSDRNALHKHLYKYHGLEINKSEVVECLDCGKSFKSTWKLENHKIACRLRLQDILNRKLEKRVNQNEVLVKFEVDEVEEETDSEVNRGDNVVVELEIQRVREEDDPFCMEDKETESADGLTKECNEKTSNRYNIRPRSKRKFFKFYPGELDEERVEHQTISKEDEFEEEYLDEAFLELQETESEGEPENVDEEFLEKVFRGKAYNRFSRSFECQICSNEFETSQKLKLHCVVEHHIRKFKCALCQHSFDDKTNLRSHHSKLHPHEVFSKSFHQREFGVLNEKICCEICSKVFASREGVKRHKELVHEKKPQVFCEHCGDNFESLKLLQSHVKQNHIDTTSIESEKVIKRRRKTTRPVKCEECGEIAYGKTGLFTHRWNKHFNIKIINRKYHCMLCEEVIKCSNSARRHYSQVHLDGAKLIRSCLDCGLDFKLFEDFKLHVEETHEYGRNQFVCMVCGLLLYSSMELSLHTKLHRAVLEKDKKLSCDLCGFLAQQKVTLEVHMVNSHGAIRKDYHATCEVCGVTFHCYQSFHSHQKTHLDPSERKYKCQFCEKTFIKPSLWRDHERTHTNPEDRPYFCEYEGCNKRYASYDSYRGHVHFSHKRVRNQCRSCNEILSSKEKLVAHIDENHPEKRRFNCRYCGKSFATQLAGVRHMANCEPVTLD